MRNRAKCKLCLQIIESLSENDIVTCKCGHITIDGGQKNYGAYAVDFDNFIRIDDEGKEVAVKYIQKTLNLSCEASQLPLEKEKSPLTKKELLEMLDQTLQSIERLPEHALSLPISNYDFYSFGTLVLAILRSP